MAKVLFCFIFFRLVNTQFQIIFHLTNPLIDTENSQHDCLRIPAYIENDSQPYELISYCMGELSSKFHLKENNIDQKLTFMQLEQQNITVEQLYQWSASIDLIENYQFYLNHPQNSKKISLSKVIFYNCTYPYFGPQCQYVFTDYKSSHFSLDDFIQDYYYYNRYEPTLFTCYLHLECNRGVYPSCLDWTEICDGKVDCLNDQIDEKHCWQLEIDHCNANEYQCSDGQCIPQEFLYDDPIIFDCIYKSDESIAAIDIFNRKNVYSNEPTFHLEDVSCARDIKPRNPDLPSFEYLTSSCVKQRNILLSQALFSIKSDRTSNECWTAWKWLVHMPIEEYSTYLRRDHQIIYKEIIKKTCSNLTYVPASPVLFGHIYFIYDTNSIDYESGPVYDPTFICYNKNHLHVPDDKRTFILNNNTCRYYLDSRFRLSPRNTGWLQTSIANLYWWLIRKTALIERNSEYLNGTTIFKCIGWSLFSSKRLLFNNITSCPVGDYTVSPLFNRTCSTTENLHYFKCRTSNECIPRHLTGDRICHCRIFDDNYCDDESFDFSYGRNHISFQTICDDFTHLSENFTEQFNETDETNCEHWPSIHIYNHCDGFWHNLNGSDELNCDPSPFLNCPSNHHICISILTNELICLPIEKGNDGIIDCLGAQDEPTKCRKNITKGLFQSFYCTNTSDGACQYYALLCDGYQDCINNEDERVCKTADYALGGTLLHGVCEQKYELYGSDIVKTLCRHFIHDEIIQWRIHFTLDQRMNTIKENITDVRENRFITQKTIEYYQPRCHRGLDLQVWLDKQKNFTTNVCLCPPSYYGSQCQYQNQRISLTLQFRVTSDSIQIPFIVIVSLIDHTYERMIHSSEQFIYTPMKNCQRKYNIYLLYSTRPKDLTKNYSIHIDVYEKITLNYRTSFIKTLNFSFLPVHRLGYILHIPPTIDDSCSDIECFHGKCVKYYHDLQNRTFCQCDRGWYGQSCRIKYDCQCSSSSICLGKLSNNRSLCICPLDKTGPRCLIDDHICQNNKTITCYNHGQCIPIDEYGLSSKKFVCICKRGTYGDRCEKLGTQLIISFDKTISLPSLLIFIHFIEVRIKAEPIRTTTVKTINVLQDSTLIHWSLPFHIVFIELSNKTYYLFHLAKIYNQSSTMTKVINPSDQCLNISEVFNQTIVNLSLLHRLKYYHLPCQINSSQLLCFYDEVHMCLCQQLNDRERVANCFEFDHSMTLDCSGTSGCINNGTCYQENTTCPRISVCQCLECYNGRRCQFNTNGYSLSLDAILGYHIQQNLNLLDQPTAIIISLIITIIITVSGFINGLLCLMTFKNKSARESGCGIYLLYSSIVTLLIMVIFILKYFILLFSQMNLIHNRLFLNIQCYSMDFLLRSNLTMNQWLTTFVAIERAFIVIKSVNFNKKKSKLIAKRAIPGLVLLTALTNILDPIYRSLFDENDDEEQRIWCIVKYPSAIQIIDSVINIIHFIVPFIINIISAIIIIIKSARQQAAARKKQTYKKLLNEQIQQHKNLLIGPCVLIILGIPRLIISFASGCMKSSKDSWLFLLGYFISLIPPLLTFILFVVPSTTYKDAFKKAIVHYRTMIRGNQ